MREGSRKLPPPALRPHALHAAAADRAAAPQAIIHGPVPRHGGHGIDTILLRHVGGVHLPPGGTDLRAVARLGAAFGLIAFAVYDLTNQATLRDWRTAMTVVDILWGGVSCGTASWIAATVTRG